MRVVCCVFRFGLAGVVLCWLCGVLVCVLVCWVVRVCCEILHMFGLACVGLCCCVGVVFE